MVNPCLSLNTNIFFFLFISPKKNFEEFVKKKRKKDLSHKRKRTGNCSTDQKMRDNRETQLQRL